MASWNLIIAGQQKKVSQSITRGISWETRCASRWRTVRDAPQNESRIPVHASSVEKMVTGQRNVLAKVHTHAAEPRLNRLCLTAYIRGTTQHHVTILPTATTLVGMRLERVAIMTPLRHPRGITDACQVLRRTSVITRCPLRGPRVITTNTGLGAPHLRVTTDPDTSGTHYRQGTRRHPLGTTIAMIEDLWMIGMSHRLAVDQGHHLAPLQVAGITMIGLRVMNSRNVWNVVGQ